jgi:hypothetical protein
LLLLLLLRWHSCCQHGKLRTLLPLLPQPPLLQP